MKRISVVQSINFINQKISLRGWVHNIREMGGIIFLDLRDRSGFIQTIIDPKIIGEKNFEEAKRLKRESVIEIEGEIKKRPEKNKNPKILTGEIELQAEKIKILNLSDDLPFEIRKDTRGVDEELRLKYRYLDLRSERMKNNLVKRHELILLLRNYLAKNGFIEIETPLLGKGTLEGAREFIVPSRLWPGKFYTLPQSPQQYKQLLMIAGLEKYFQFARCFRDEDGRADRQPDFTQLDIEMSFAERNEIMSFTEKMIIEAVNKIFPEKKISQIPFPRINYEESLRLYQSDKPDLRPCSRASSLQGKKIKENGELSFVWVVNQPLFEYSKTEKKLVSVHHPFTAPQEDNLDKLEKEPLKARAEMYDLVLNGEEIAGGSVRIHSPKLQQMIFKILGLAESEIKEKFGHLIEAFKFGAPPHGGIAFGFDRLVSILCNEKTIREVIAFPKTGDLRDPLTGSPSELPEKQLAEANIKIRKKLT